MQESASVCVGTHVGNLIEATLAGRSSMVDDRDEERDSACTHSCWYPRPVIGLIVLGVLATVLGLVLVANSRWAAGRGWAYNKHNPRPSGSGIPTTLDEIYQPSIEHVAEERASEAARADQDESGDKPNAG